VLASLADAPEDLRSLGREAIDASVLERFDVPPPLPGRKVRKASPRKRAQIDALLAAVSEIAGDASRIVDFGSGHGQLTDLAAEALALPSIGFERDPTRVERAGRMAGSREARFVALDALADDVPLREDDVAVGLHACGALGDRLIMLAAERGAAVALVGCCPQKIRAEERQPLSSAARGLALPKDALGLANLSPGEEGVERSLEATLEARAARHALALLLADRGVALAPGAEMQGLNRRRALAPFADLAAAACAVRGLAPPSPGEIDRSLDRGLTEYRAMRRLSLPRGALARVVEVFLALDRAAHLEEAGRRARVVELFSRSVTPRNVAVLAARQARSSLSAPASRS
jgi:hypothetical protein